MNPTLFRWSVKKIRTVAATRCRRIYSVYIYIHTVVSPRFVDFVQKVQKLEVVVEFWKVRRMQTNVFLRSGDC